MADIIPPGFAEITIPLQHEALARAAAVVFGVEDEGGVVNPDTIAGLVQTAFVNTLGVPVDEDVTIGPTIARMGQDGGEALVGYASGTAPGGASRADAIAANTAALIHKRTQRGGRRGRGRMYLPWCISDANVSETGVLGTAQRDGLSTDANDFLGDLAAAGVPMYLLHSSGVSTTGDPNLVTSMSCDPIVGTQRRRLGR